MPFSPRAGVSLEKRYLIPSRIHWPVAIGILVMHLGCLPAPWFFTWSGLVVLGVLYFLTGAIGITLCYHRLLTHRSFRVPAWLECLLTISACLAWQGGPVQWVGVHRIHHRHSDEDLDPHTPNHGFTWAHMTWCLHRETGGMRARDAARDLLRNPVLRFLDNWFWVPQFLLVPTLFFAGEWFGNQGWFEASGLSWVIWGVFVRTVLVYHSTWFVNSASHTWGYRNYATQDRSTNLWWVALLSFGEGWHNNHHAHQRSAAHGLRWYEFDLTYWIIRCLGWMGLAKDIVLPRPEEFPGVPQRSKAETREVVAER
jgi:fatty-acid desaturase